MRRPSAFGPLPHPPGGRGEPEGPPPVSSSPSLLEPPAYPDHATAFGLWRGEGGAGQSHLGVSPDPPRLVDPRSVEPAPQRPVPPVEGEPLDPGAPHRQVEGVADHVPGRLLV